MKDYVFEMTTKSFKIDSDGNLVVNEKNLDRDPPNENKLGFQVGKFFNQREISYSEMVRLFLRFLFGKLMLKMTLESHPLRSQ